MFSLCGYSDRLVTINKDDKSVHTIDHEYIPDATENGSITYSYILWLNHINVKSDTSSINTICIGYVRCAVQLRYMLVISIKQLNI